MPRELSMFERQTFQAIDSSRMRYLEKEKSQDLIWEIGNQLSLWSSLRGYHYALLGWNGMTPPPIGKTCPVCGRMTEAPDCDCPTGSPADA